VAEFATLVGRLAADRALLVVSVAACGASLAFALFGVLRHHAYRSAAMDFAFFDQIVWNSAHGRWFETSFVPYNFLGQHVEPVLLLFAALYRIAPAPEWLLVVQALAAGCAAIPLYLLGKRRLTRTWLAALLAVAYLLSPVLHRAVAFDYHSEVMAPLFVFSGLALLHADHELAGTAALLGILLLKEDAALVLVGLSLPLWCWGMRRAAVVAGVAGFAWIVLVVGLFMPAVRGEQSDLEGRYLHLGSGAGGIAGGIARHPPGALDYSLGPRQRKAVAKQLALQGGLPLLAPLTLVAAAPVAALQFLSSHDRQQSLDLHYSAQVLPIVIVASIEGLRRLERHARHPVVARRVAAGFIVIGTVWGIHTAGHFPLTGRYTAINYTRPAQADAIERGLAMVPADASVSAQSGLAAHLSQRERIWEFPVLNDAEYVILDLEGPIARPYERVYGAKVAALPSRGYKLVWSEAGIRVYRKREDAP
jgi:uncharacterized membrane protein